MRAKRRSCGRSVLNAPRAPRRARESRRASTRASMLAPVTIATIGPRGARFSLPARRAATPTAPEASATTWSRGDERHDRVLDLGLADAHDLVHEVAVVEGDLADAARQSVGERGTGRIREQRVAERGSTRANAGEASGWTATIRTPGARAFSTVATPASRPPPPTGTSTTAGRGHSSRISSASVPCPAAVRASSKAWTKTAPSASRTPARPRPRRRRSRPPRARPPGSAAACRAWRAERSSARTPSPSRPRGALRRTRRRARGCPPRPPPRRAACSAGAQGREQVGGPAHLEGAGGLPALELETQVELARREARAQGSRPQLSRDDRRRPARRPRPSVAMPMSPLRPTPAARGPGRHQVEPRLAAVLGDPVHRLGAQRDERRHVRAPRLDRLTDPQREAAGPRQSPVAAQHVARAPQRERHERCAGRARPP